MTDNKALHNAARAQQDEFYTQLSDIENELRHYKAHFRGKKILCNCDDPYESNFFKYFAMNFNAFGLKKLTATCYNGSPIAQLELPLFEIENEKKSYCAEITEFKDYNGDTAEDLDDIKYGLIHNLGGGVRELKGNGDFRSDECIELLRDADIVVTNPPFSLFREYIAQLVKYGKKFIILGNKNAITYKEVFPLFMHNQMWLGATIHSGGVSFRVPDYYDRSENFTYREENGKLVKLINTPGPRWFTNLEHDQMPDKMILFREYHKNPDLYPKYDNYDAIEVSKTQDIPCDYDGVMGVPITFLDKYNSEQFEILGITEKNSSLSIGEGKSDRPYINGKRMYARLLIRRKDI